VLDINLKGTWLVARAVLPGMVARGSGSIVNLASVEGIEGGQSQTAYNASKGGVVLLTRSMAVDYGPNNVRVNCLCPGMIETPMTAPLQDSGLRPVLEWFEQQHVLGRCGKPEEVAAAALFLASDDASFVTGHALAVDGGYLAGRRFPGTL
jgi:NAD(P)-dependent dehydrogenase (short-subunit alcohol dehydrogenase family)